MKRACNQRCVVKSLLYISNPTGTWCMKCNLYIFITYSTKKKVYFKCFRMTKFDYHEPFLSPIGLFPNVIFSTISR
jgi:hypothetical protein